MTQRNQHQAVEVADIFLEYGPLYRQSYNLPLQHLKAMTAIEACRTKVLGGHLEECDSCGAEVPAYNSCRNRHCPKCGWLPKERWLLRRKEELLTVTYFHVVLTIPDLLNPLALVNQQVIYDILFRAGSETLLTLGKDPKHLGGDLGIMAILHTWGKNLIDHPHLHCVVPGGGLSEDEVEWMKPKKSKKRKKFFVHVNVISDLFKKKFLSYLDQAYQKDELKFEGKIAYLKETAQYKKFKTFLYAKRWVTFCKRPFGGPNAVLEYLSRYTHKVAISNHRIIKVENGRVHFKWKNYRKDGKSEQTSLEIFEFIRRFLLHVLPKNFYKIRYYGILASRNHKRKLAVCREILEMIVEEVEPDKPEKSFEEWFFELTGKESGICPVCKKGRLVRKNKLKPEYLVPI